MTSQAANTLSGILDSRRSVRAFLPDPLSSEEIETLFSMAQKAPSWCNIQPWRLTLTTKSATESIRNALVETAKSSDPNPDIPFPSIYPAPYGERRKECGIALYGAMDITRENKEGRYDAWLRNYEIFDAPHLLVVSRDERLGEYATLDVGVWLGTLLVAAESMGIQTCAMASIAAYPDLLREQLDIPAEEKILVGIAIGRADNSKKVNSARTTRQNSALFLRLRE